MKCGLPASRSEPRHTFMRHAWLAVAQAACESRKREQPGTSECSSKGTAGWRLYAEVQGHGWCD